jgi:putative nucleotidyltransferase with HDIG domain
MQQPSGSRRAPALPYVLAATALVAVVPSLVAYGLLSSGIVRSSLLSIALATALSLLLSQGCGRLWERRGSSKDMLFADLMLWGHVQRKLLERRLARAEAMYEFATRELAPSSELPPAAERMRLLHRLAKDLEATDPYTVGHSRRVARYSSQIASRMGLPRTDVRRIRAAAALHDIGKINTPRTILHKPARLTDEEFAIIQLHAEDGARMISHVAQDSELVAIVRHHHERLDGSGYPDGLHGAAIPLGARIIAVADTFDAITSERPYRRAKPHKLAMDILHRESGSRLDPAAVSAFTSVYFASRPLGAVVALGNSAERLLSNVGARLLGAGRVAGLAAAAAGLGTIGVAPRSAVLPGLSISAHAAAPSRSAPPARSTVAVVYRDRTSPPSESRIAHSTGRLSHTRAPGPVLHYGPQAQSPPAPTGGTPNPGDQGTPSPNGSPGASVTTGDHSSGTTVTADAGGSLVKVSVGSSDPSASVTVAGVAVSANVGNSPSLSVSAPVLLEEGSR